MKDRRGTGDEKPGDRKYAVGENPACLVNWRKKLVKGPLYLITCDNQACDARFTSQDKPSIYEIKREGWDQIEGPLHNTEYCPECKTSKEYELYKLAPPDQELAKCTRWWSRGFDLSVEITNSRLKLEITPVRFSWWQIEGK